MTIWFTSDTHFGHGNVIQYTQRPFETVEEMDARLTENWNQSVKPNEIIYHLGDFTLLGAEPASEYFQRLNGRIHIIPGGHDHRWLGRQEYFSRSGHVVTILPPLKTIKVTLSGLDQPQLIVLCHYAMRVWDRSHYGSWHLFGHSHGNLPPLESSLDVGVDVWDLAPILLEAIGSALMKT